MRTKNRYVAYGMAENMLYKYTFTYNNATEIITLSYMNSKAVSGLDGSLTRLQVSNNHLVISCSDCSTP